MHFLFGKAVRSQLVNANIYEKENAEMENSSNLVLSNLSSGLKFGDLICSALRKPVYLFVEKIGVNNTSILSLGDWAGGKSNEPSRAPYVAHCKAGELLWCGQKEGVSTTPVFGLEISNGWKGGVRFGSHIVAVSKLSQEHDELIAAVILYYMQSENVQFHHAGFSCTEAEFELVRNYGFLFDSKDNKRVYLPVSDERSVYRKYYAEYFCDPNSQSYGTTHLDFVCQDYAGFLSFVGKAVGVKPEFWHDSEEYEPAGSLWVADSEGKKIGIMARPIFWNIK